MAFSFTLTDVIPATQRQIYDAWLDSRGHTAMTGSAAEASSTEGATFTAWGGYISGRNLTLEPGLRIVQAWRTTRFTAEDPDSRIEVLLEADGEGTKLTLHHTDVPDGHTGYQDGGWQEHYFDPMKRHFGAPIGGDGLGIDPALLVRRFYDEVWKQADEDVARTILHPDLAFRGSLGPTRTGPDGFIGYMREIHAALGDFRCTIDDMVVADDRVAARMTFAGIHRATLFGVPPTGKRITWSGAAFFTMLDQRIKDIWVLGDIDAVKQQLGAAGTAAFG